VLSDRQAVEFFHLQFIRLLCAGPDRNRFAIKGGCNLRFFFESVRYSEDLDLDVDRMPVHTLKEKVANILELPSFVLPLKGRGLSIGEVSAPKQTETTQRWKIGLFLAGRSSALHTKVEFSRRGSAEKTRIEPVAQMVLAEYQLLPLLAPHYPLDGAVRQKVGALVGRSTVQARDVFDLAVLFARAGGPEALSSARGQLGKAVERAMDVSYADFKSQVASYLKPEHLDEYGTRESWNALQSRVLDVLQGAQP
jgi:Nucleotidyl transferase AbiEii toxin, Type IV TA system